MSLGNNLNNFPRFYLFYIPVLYLSYKVSWLFVLVIVEIYETNKTMIKKICTFSCFHLLKHSCYCAVECKCNFSSTISSSCIFSIIYRNLEIKNETRKKRQSRFFISFLRKNSLKTTSISI